MRSVFIHLWDTSEREVGEFLDKHYVPEHEQWLHAIDDDPYLYISFYRDGPVESDDWEGRFASRGGPPDVSVCADLSGRHDGWPEAQSFVVGLLERFRGVADDDAGLRFWTRDEVHADRSVDGRRFGSWRN